MKIYHFLFSICFVLIFFGQGKAAVSDAQLKRLITNLNSSDWGTVSDAKDSLEQLEKDAIPYLIANLNSENKYVHLQNTGDLIYPGATEFWGHGWSIDYDLDWLCIRSGWVLEEITFQDWGFSDYPNDSDKTLSLKERIAKTNSWWAANSSSWSRLTGITSALKSNNDVMQFRALDYLMLGDFCINGLTKDYFNIEMRPTVNLLLSSPNKGIAEKAQTFLDLIDFKGCNYPTRCWK